MKSDEVYVKKSKINGEGSFAGRDFKKGEIVHHWDMSHRISEQEFFELSDKEKEYVSLINGRYTKMQSPENRTNNSCNYNVEVKNFCDVAIRDIKKDEEITSDYSKESPPGFEMICHCGAENCRKIIKS